jgi:hypothetical protein
MRLSERRKEGKFYFVARHGPGQVVGGEVEITVYAASDGNGVWLLSRTLYFDEQSREHIDNFRKEFAFDDKYRRICLEGAAHWSRVARLYEVNARIMQDEQAIGPKVLEKRGRELFHIIRRDLAEIEGSPEYRQEMARVGEGREEDLREALDLLAGIKNLQVTSACQGSARLQIAGRNLYLPSCHSVRATITMSNFPVPLRIYLQSGPLGQRHLALFEEDKIKAATPFHNKRFIQMLTASLHGFSLKR